MTPGDQILLRGAASGHANIGMPRSVLLSAEPLCQHFRLIVKWSANLAASNCSYMGTRLGREATISSYHFRRRRSRDSCCRRHCRRGSNLGHRLLGLPLPGPKRIELFGGGQRVQPRSKKPSWPFQPERVSQDIASVACGAFKYFTRFAEASANER